VPNIFQYSDYRKYLADWLKEKKAGAHRFPYHRLAQRCGFTSKSYIHYLLNGKRNLSPASAEALARGLGLSRNESAYFRNLAAFNQARNHGQQELNYQRLKKVKPFTAEASQAWRLRQDQHELYSHWHNLAVWSLIDLYPRLGYKEFCQMLWPRVAKPRVRQAVRLLEKLGLITLRPEGGYKVCHKTLSTGPEVQSLAVHNFHLEAMGLAARALRELPPEKRNVTGLTLGISDKSFTAIKEKTQAFQQDILDLAVKDKEADKVYQLNMQLFPLSGVYKRKPRKKKTH